MQYILGKIAEVAIEEHKNVYIVGGYIRDLLASRTAEKIDIDFAVEKGAIELAKKVADKLGASFVLLDQPRGTARVVYKQGDQVCELDFADFRQEVLEADLLHRDFTINAIARQLGDDARIDPYHGEEDIRKKIIRAVHESAFVEDPLRILRAFSFRGILGFEIEKATLELMKPSVKGLAQVSPERITDELYKIFCNKGSYKSAKDLDQMGALEVLMPQIASMKGSTQGPYHHLDVWDHSLESLLRFEELIDELSASEKEPAIELKAYFNEDITGGRKRLWIFKLGVLLHDLGKPPARKVEEGKIKFIGHETIGEDILGELGKDMRLSSREIDILKKISRHHLRPGYLADSPLITKKALFRFFRDTDPEGPGIMFLAIADKFATCGPMTPPEARQKHKDIILGIIKDYYRKKEELARPPKLVTGDELIAEVGVKPGPILGEILREIEEAQVEGQVKTRQDAVDLARKIWLKHSPDQGP